MKKPLPSPHYEGHRQRLRERFLASKGMALQDYELLELLLFFVFPRKDVKPLAKELLQKFGSFQKVFHGEISDLLSVSGMGQGGVVFLKALKESAIRLSYAEIEKKDVFSSWEKVVAYCRLACGHEKVEQFRILFLDRKNQLIADEPQQKGTVDHASVYPREVVKRALELGASALILLHNHPSADPTPSPADIDVTLKIMDAARPLSITVHDHLIITQNNHASLKALGLI